MIEVNNEIEEGIRTQRFHAVTDTSVTNKQMRGYWNIVYFNNHGVASKEMLTNNGV